MDIKLLIGILGRPWLIEPSAALHWASIAEKVLDRASAPDTDKRRIFGDQGKYGTGPVFRVDPKGKIDPSGSIQVLRMNAPVAKYDFCGSPGSQTWIQNIRAANADDSIKAILLWIDSPGGQVDGTEALANEVRNSAKPVVTYADSVICSAAYWIGSSASEIIIDGSNNGWNAQIGSIGTMARWEDDSEKAQKEGIKRVTVFADSSPDKWGDYFATKEGDYTRLKQELNGINETFLSAVKANRGDKLNLDKENVLSGKVYNAKEAIKYGLADRSGTFQDAVKRANYYSNSINTPKMSQSKTTTTAGSPFTAVLSAAKSEAFQVVEGGFLLSEEQLISLNTHLEQQQATASATASQLIALQGFKEKAEGAVELDTKLTAAHAENQKLTADLQAAKDTIATYGKLPGATFAQPSTSTITDPAPATAEDPQAKKKQYSFDKNAAAVLDM